MDCLPNIDLPDDDPALVTATHSTAPLAAETGRTKTAFSVSVSPSDPPLSANMDTQSPGAHASQNLETSETTKQLTGNDPKSTNISNHDNLTLQPFVPRKITRAPSDRRRGQGNQRRRTVHHDNQLQRPVPRDFRKFFLVRASDGGNLSRIDVIRANREIETQLDGKPFKISETRTGTLILEIRNEAQCARAVAIRSLAGIAVTVAEHDRLNERKGTIWYANHFNYDDEQLLQELNRSGVKSIYRTKKKQDNTLVPTPIYILTFECDIPEKVTIGWTQCSVRSYIPKPRRCFKCQAFGHGATTCRRNTGICFNCSEEAHELPCERSPKCINCGDPHPASSRNCHIYKIEEETLATQVKERITYGEARRLVKDRFVKPQTTYAQATQRQTNIQQTTSHQNTPATHEPPRTIRTNDGSTQTEPDNTISSDNPSQPPTEHDTTRSKSKDQKPRSSSISCKPQQGGTVYTLPARKRPQSNSSSPGSPDHPKSTKKPTLSTDVDETRSRNRPPTDTGRRPSLEDRRSQLLKQYPVPSYAPTVLPPTVPPPMVHTRPWEQRNKKHEPAKNVSPTKPKEKDKKRLFYN